MNRNAVSTSKQEVDSGRGIRYRCPQEALMNQNRPRGVVVVALLMILFGLAEVTTGITHNFFGISTARVTSSAYAGVAIGALYAMAGLLILSMKKRAAALAIVFLILDIVGRIAMVVTGLYPVHPFGQAIAIILGTSIVAIFAVYIGSKWSSFS
jgi:peptidoglycan/LPS O-acetylase OafA/YrhL